MMAEHDDGQAAAPEQQPGAESGTLDPEQASVNGDRPGGDSDSPPAADPPKPKPKGKGKGKGKAGRDPAELVDYLQDTGTGGNKLEVCRELMARDGVNDAADLAEAMQADARVPQGTMNKVAKWFGIDPAVLQQ